MGSSANIQDLDDRTPDPDQLAKIEEAFHSGIPNDLRKDIWPIIVPNNL